MAKILILDIETAPHIAYVWGLWKQNVGLNQIKERSRILTYAAKWLGEPDHAIDSAIARTEDEERTLLIRLAGFLDQADVVVTHNGKKFDLPVVLGRMLVYGIDPPSPFHQVDTYQVARREFRFASNSLENIAIELDCRKKDGHKKYPGFELWLGVLRDEKEAWEEMLHYNKQDVYVLEDVYLRMRPYMRGHPHVGGGGHTCPKCGSEHVQKRGSYRTAAGIEYQRYQCIDCGGWGRSRTLDSDQDRTEIRNAR